MAIAVPSSASSAFALGTSRVITKPTGLAVGDLMLAVIGIDSGTAADVNTPSGWTQITVASFDSNQAEIRAFSRIADAGDVAASDFTFTSTASTYIAGCLLRVTGHPASAFLDVSDADTNDSASSATISFSTSLATAVNGELIVEGFLGTLGGSGTGTIGTYATSDSVTFTEGADHSVDNGTRDPIFGVAYGVQGTAATITTYGATLSASRTNHGGVIFAIKPVINATGTHALHSADADFFAEAGVSVGGTGTHTLLSADADFFSTSGEGVVPTVWTPITKS